MNNSIYLQLISLNKNHNEHYLKRYVKLVSFFKERNWSYTSGLHHEHHIVPESFGGLDTNENLVCITIREHFILHWILYKAFPKSSMVTAFHMMCNCWSKDFRITSKVYQNAMLEFIETQKKKVLDGTHPWQDKEKARQRANKRVAEGTHPWQDKEKARQRARKQLENGTHNFNSEMSRKNNLKRVTDGTHNFLGGEISRRTAKKQLENGTHPFLGGEIQGRNSRQRVADGTHHFLGKNNPVYNQIKKLCLHCNKEFYPSMFSRWHGDNCKLNQNKLKGNCE